MDFINKIGQRKFANIFLALAVIIPLVIFALKQIKGDPASSFFSIKTLFATLLFCIPNILFSIAAHKSRDFRLFSLFLSFITLILNSGLFFLTIYDTNVLVFFSIVLLIEIVFSLAFLIFVVISENNKRKNRQSRVKTTKINTAENE